MDPKVSQIPGKCISSRLKFPRKVSEPPKITAHEPPISRQKRVFGTVRSTNIPSKTVNELPVVKPQIDARQKQPKSTRSTQYAVNASTKHAFEAADQKLTETRNSRPKKKSPAVRQNVKERILKDLHVDNVVEPRTPVAVPRLFKVKNAGTPYHTAEKCSKCRFDKMETSSYWLTQIKLAESVGKHFVSASFFRLAYECNAEPIRNLKVELKHYITRHEHMSAHAEWKDVCVTYGLLKDENGIGGQNPFLESITPEISSSELNRDHAEEATESRIPEMNSDEVIKDQTEATESKKLEISRSSELDKDQIVGSSAGEPAMETSEERQDPLSSETQQTYQS